MLLNVKRTLIPTEVCFACAVVVGIILGVILRARVYFYLILRGLNRALKFKT